VKWFEISNNIGNRYLKIKGTVLEISDPIVCTVQARILEILQHDIYVDEE